MKIIKLLFFLIFTYIYSSNIYGQVYCNASSTSNISNINDYISKVEFGSISNNSFNTTYSNFTSLSTTINKGIASTLTITLNYTYGVSTSDNDQVLVWIDWNQDGDFLDSGEKVFTSVVGGPYTASITAPFSAVLGNTRMRIRLHDTSFGPNSTSCGISDYGEVEDYTVNVSSIVPSVPNACAASSITAFGYDFISKVEIGTILKNSGYSNYSDYTNNTIVTNMTRGVSSPFTITLGGYPIPGDLSDQIFIWIDWNHDGDFIDSGESVYTSIVSVGPFTGSITPPNTALLGGARMRIRLHDTDYGPNSTPCGTSDYGEVEDYVINLQAPFLTVSSNALTIGAPANSTASLGITSNIAWSITNSDPTWLALSSSTGSNNGTITLTAAVNSALTTRTATLVVSGSGVTAQTITVTQDAGSAFLNVSSNTISIDAPANSSGSFNIVSNTAWVISNSQPTWLSLNSNLGSNDYSVVLTASENTSSLARSATLTVSGNGFSSQVITVVQAPTITTNQLDELSKNICLLYPNPATSRINLQFNSTEVNNFDVEISNALGEIIKVDALIENNVMILELQNLENGVYFIQLINRLNSSVERMKFVKE